jgi:hypothetical protein
MSPCMTSMEERERCYSFILFRTLHETKMVNKNKCDYVISTDDTEFQDIVFVQTITLVKCGHLGEISEMSLLPFRGYSVSGILVHVCKEVKILKALIKYYHFVKLIDVGLFVIFSVF